MTKQNLLLMFFQRVQSEVSLFHSFYKIKEKSDNYWLNSKFNDHRCKFEWNYMMHTCLCCNDVKLSKFIEWNYLFIFNMHSWCHQNWIIFQLMWKLMNWISTNPLKLDYSIWIVTGCKFHQVNSVMWVQ